jgi:hypothetical protein
MTYPPGYPLASSGSRKDPRSSGDSDRLTPTKHTRPTGRVSQRRLADIAGRLSQRDREIIATVGRFRVMSAGQLQRLFWTEGAPQTRARLARHGLTRLHNLGVLATLERRVGGVRAGSTGRLFALAPAGQGLHRPHAGRRTRHPHTPGERHLAHQLAVGDLYASLRAAAHEGAIELPAFDVEPACWRTYPGSWGSRLILKPDAFVKVATRDYIYSWFIEIDMATESLATIDHKLRRHLDYHHTGNELRAHGVAPRVAWIAPTERRATAIEGVIQALSPDSRKLFAVATSHDAIDLLRTGVGA